MAQVYFVYVITIQLDAELWQLCIAFCEVIADLRYSIFPLHPVVHSTKVQLLKQQIMGTDRRQDFNNCEW